MKSRTKSSFRWTWFCTAFILALVTIVLFPTLELLATVVFGALFFIPKERSSRASGHQYLVRGRPEIFSGQIVAVVVLLILVAIRN